MTDDTTAGLCNDDTTTVPPPTEPAPHGLAWGAEDDDEPVIERHPWTRALGIAAGILVAAGAFSASAWTTYGSHDVVVSSAPVTTLRPTVVTTTARPAPPVVTTIVRSVPVFTTAEDQALLTDLRSHPTLINVAHPALVIDQAHRFCLLIVSQHQTVEQADADIQTATGWDGTVIAMVTAGAIAAYPGCDPY